MSNPEPKPNERTIIFPPGWSKERIEDFCSWLQETNPGVEIT